MSFLRSAVSLATSISFCVVLVLGCRSRAILEQPPVNEAPRPRQIEVPCISQPVAESAVNVTEPLTIETLAEPEDWSMTLEEVVKITLANSEVIREIGGRVIAPNAASVYDPALQELGVEAALSAFDAQIASGISFVRDERAFNNQFFGGGANTRSSNTAAFNLEVSKRAATGTLFAVRNITDYDHNDSPFNEFKSIYNTQMEAQFTQPLLRGNGLDVNRISGPNAQPGTFNGVMIARIRTDIALADFEASVRGLILNVENAYWQLYFAYRNLDAQKAAYEAALASWRNVQNGVEAGTADAEEEALARANYYQAKAAIQNALSGSAGGTGVLGVIGVYSAERNLRILMGVPANDGRLIRPTDEPTSAEAIFDWNESLALSLDRRVELRRQRWIVKQRESELLASRNLLLSQLDLIGLYRWRGFGDDLLGNRDIPNGSAFSDLYSGALQGWQLGLQYSTAIGRRREHAAVRSAELQLSRERAVLRNQELSITNDLSGQFGELARTYAVAQNNFNISVAQRQRLDTATAKYEEGEELLVFVLEAQRNAADADSQFYRSMMDYNMAIANMHFSRGTYMDYMGVKLSEGPWSPESYRSYSKEFRRFKPVMNYCKMEPSAVSRGTYAQTPPQSQAYYDGQDAGQVEPFGQPMPAMIEETDAVSGQTQVEFFEAEEPPTPVFDNSVQLGTPQMRTMPTMMRIEADPSPSITDWSTPDSMTTMPIAPETLSTPYPVIGQ